jgi:hypothetical protein
MPIRAALPAPRPAARTLAAPWPVLILVAAALGGCGWFGTGGTPGLPAADTAPAAAPPPGQRALRITLGGRPAYATLLQEQRERRLWRTEGGFALATDGPRVVATSGLPQVLMATRLDGPDPLAAPKALLGREAPARRLVALATAARDPAGMRFGLEIVCRLSATPGEAPELLLVEEACRGPREVGSFTNRFTLRRGDGAVLRSEQWIGPGLPPLVLEAAAAE